MRADRRSTCAALTVQAASASAGESFSCVAASEQTRGRLSQKALPGLKSVASATIVAGVMLQGRPTELR